MASMNTGAIQNLYGWFTRLSSLSASRQLTFLLGLAGSVALGMWLILWIQQPSMVPLYGDISTSDRDNVIEILDRRGVEYRYNARSGLVEVPPDQVATLRMQLASEGFPESSGRGFEMLYQPTELGLSSFIEKARYDRALEEELARSIASMGSVRTARVHLAIPEVSGYLRDRAVPEASVLISLGSGMSLSDQQVMGIQYLVSSSVADLPAEKVSVIDSQGRLLSRTGGEESAFGLGQDRFQMSRQMESHYVDRILDLLTPLVGADAVRAQVAVDLNFTSVETTAERYDPEAAVRSEQVSEERSDSTVTGGIPGTLSNQPPEEASLVEAAGDQLGGAEQAPSTTTNAIRNYELDRTISHTKESPGAVNRLSVAVVLDYVEQLNEEGVLERVPMPAEEIEHIRALVREAVGFNELRGDSLNVVSASFMPPIEIEPLPAPAIWEQAWLWRALRTILASGLLIGIFFTLVRPMLKAGQAAAPAALAVGAASATALAAPDATGDQQQVSAAMGLEQPSEDRVTLAGANQLASTIPYEQQLLLARSMAEEQPQRVAQVVRNWVVADE